MRNRQIILRIVLCVLVMAASALGVSRKPKSGNDTKSKVADTVKQSDKAKDSATKSAVPTTPVRKDSAAAKVPTPARFNDFQDKNKNGIDDRLDKTGTDAKKPAPTATKKPETKKSETKKSSTITRTPLPSKKSK